MGSLCETRKEKEKPGRFKLREMLKPEEIICANRTSGGENRAITKTTLH